MIIKCEKCGKTIGELKEGNIMIDYVFCDKCYEEK